MLDESIGSIESAMSIEMSKAKAETAGGLVGDSLLITGASRSTRKSQQTRLDQAPSVSAMLSRQMATVPVE